VVRTDSPHSGGYHVRLRRNASDFIRNIDTTGQSNVTLSFWSRVRSFEGSDQASVQVSRDGESWTTVKLFQNGDDDNTYHFHELEIPEELIGGMLSVRFEASMSSNNDFWYLDDVKFISRPPNTPPLDIRLNRTYAIGHDQLIFDYQILGQQADSFDFSIFRSADKVHGQSDSFLDSVTISDINDLTVGRHTVQFTIGNEILLPGYGVTETNEDYYLLAVADPSNSIPETDIDPVNDDNMAVFDGIYHDTTGAIFIHGDDTGESFTVEQGSVRVITDGGTVIYNEADVSGIRVRGHGGDDVMEIDLITGIDVFVHGGSGSDKVIVNSTAANDTATLRPGSLVMSGSANVFAQSAEEIFVFGNGGIDKAKLYDSAGDNKLIAKPGYNWFRGDGLSSYVNGFSMVDAYATAGGIDTARLYDSAGNDTHTSFPTLTRLRGNGFNNTARNFEIVEARSSAGGIDTATFHDSAGDDLFVGKSTFS